MGDARGEQRRGLGPCVVRGGPQRGQSWGGEWGDRSLQPPAC